MGASDIQVVVRTLEPLASRRPDPLNIAAALPLTGVYHPLGFRFEIETNSPDVLAAAAEAWDSPPSETRRKPFMLRVLVSPEGPLAEEGAHRKHGHLYSIISDPHNFASIDLRSGFGFIHVSQATASDHSWLRWFFLEGVAYTMLCQRDVVMIHAACVARGGSGILLCGPTEAGKSTLSYACARAGWTWLADDCVCLLAGSTDRMTFARSPVARFRLDAPALFPELERFAARARPTGKIGIEVPMAALPEIETARRAPIRSVAFLDRSVGPAVRIPISRDECVDRLLADMPRYGPEVDEVQERAARALAEAPAFRVRYDLLADGVRLLSDL